MKNKPGLLIPVFFAGMVLLFIWMNNTNFRTSRLTPTITIQSPTTTNQVSKTQSAIYPILTSVSVTDQSLNGTSTPILTLTATTQYETITYLENYLGGYTIEDLRSGKARFDYPSSLAPDTRDVVYLSIFIPVENYGEHRIYLTTTPSDTPQPIRNGFTTWEKDITVSPTMRAELISLDFSIQPEFQQAKRTIDMSEGNLTTWSWSIKSSNVVGIQTMFLRVYLGDAEDPIWAYRMQVDVQHPTILTPITPTGTPLPTWTPSATVLPTTTATPTPIPVAQTPEFIVGSGALIALIGFAGSIVAAFISRSAKKQESHTGNIEKDIKELKRLLTESGRAKRARRN